MIFILINIILLMKKMREKVILFDFDGTLVDTISIVENIIHKIGPRYGLNLEEKSIQAYRDLPAADILKKIALRPWLIPFFVGEIKLRIHFKKNEIQFFNHIPQLLEKLAHQGYKIQILSSNSSRTIKKIMKEAGLMHTIDMVYASSKLFSKDQKLKKIEQSINGKLLYIGDEVRDVEACNQANIDIIAVSWGYNSENILNKQKTNCLVNDPTKLFQAVESYFEANL